MTTITLEVPDELAQKLRATDPRRDLSTIALDILKKELNEPATTKPGDLPYEVWRERFEAMLKDLPRVDVEVDDCRETIYEGR